ncbi:NAD(P)/FAD-dependent oxidoreductase [uncultured Limosilactobacillus sp.]|uniref:NAD(P)/FAD-dependent oxidoreductase n=1 Tax=uncultured Limosilactobacillus sp. TaxID=2837629 RepID=UPI0025CFE386|nr:NAD(P)/FAD-dependent oxidoreductase [uncultured Limosilactobacillus sp.]
MKKIVVLGAGYAGLKTVVALQKKIKGVADITLVDQNDYHYEATDLHEVASGNLPASKITYPIKDVLDPAVTTFVQDRVIKLNAADKTVELANHAPLNYDYCVMALGFVSENFGIKGATANSLPMANVDEAKAIHEHLVTVMKHYRQSQDVNDLKIIICGAGFTGIELAGALDDAKKRLAGIAGVNADDIQITLIDASNRLLPMFDEKLANYGVNLLNKLHIQIIKGALINEIQPGKVLYKKQGEADDAALHEESANTIIWTTGVSGSPVVGESGLPQRRGRVMDTEHLTAPDDDQLYMVGDVAAVMPPDGKRPYPTTAQISLSMANYVAKDLSARVKGGQRPRAYTYKSLGTVASVGNTRAFGVAMGGHYRGYPASFIKKMIMNKSLLETGGMKELMAKGRFDLYH